MRRKLAPRITVLRANAVGATPLIYVGKDYCVTMLLAAPVALPSHEARVNRQCLKKMRRNRQCSERQPRAAE